jgi:hypothetical protein
MQASNCIFPSLASNTHIVGTMNGISLGIEIPHGYTLVTYGLCILGVPMGFQDFAMHFLDLSGCGTY